jgi:hypothetical protein
MRSNHHHKERGNPFTAHGNWGLAADGECIECLWFSLASSANCIVCWSGSGARCTPKICLPFCLPYFPFWKGFLFWNSNLNKQSLQCHCAPFMWLSNQSLLEVLFFSMLYDLILGSQIVVWICVIAPKMIFVLNFWQPKYADVTYHTKFKKYYDAPEVIFSSAKEYVLYLLGCFILLFSCLVGQ